MISTARFRNFKCFGDASFDVAPLTVLTGVNGGGKTTFLHGLLLARLAVSPGRQSSVKLNGVLGLNSGSAADVLHWDAAESMIHVEIDGKQITFDVPPDEFAQHLNIGTVPTEPMPGIDNPAPAFTYLAAERLGPRDQSAVSADEPDDIGVGIRGEFTAQVLALREARLVGQRTTVRQELWHHSSDISSLRAQTEAWASEIIRPIRITAEFVPGLLATAIRFDEPGRIGVPIRPANTGFGVSYALPIIVAGLLAQPGDLLLIENPEAHLHPSGQSRLGRFLARVAGSGAQVIVETHSDHVLNGARLAVAADRTPAPSDMLIHYFDARGAQHITVDEHGKLSRWPAGFFDQMDTDLSGLARVGRR